MNIVDHSKVYYRGCETIEHLVQVMNKADSRNEFFISIGLESRVEYETFIDKNQYIIKFYLWRVS